MRVFLVCSICIFFFMNGTCRRSCNKEKECVTKLIAYYILGLSSIDSGYEPNNTFEEALCISFPISDFLGRPDSVDVDKDYFFLYSKKQNFKTLRLKEFPETILFKIYSHKESRTLLNPISQKEIQITSQKDGKKYNATLEEFQTNGESFIYLYLESSLRNFYKLQLSEKLDANFDAEQFVYRDSQSTLLLKSHIFFQGEFSCSP